MNSCHLLKANNKGFTLIELAIVLIVVGLLVAAFLMPLSAQVDLQRYNQTKQQLDDAKEALYGYAMSHTATDGNPYLPCPDTNNDGIEEPRGGGGLCPPLAQEGRLPWVTLGIARGDSWGNLIRYRVHPFYSSDVNGFTLNTTTTTGFRVCQNSPCTATNIIGTNIPAILISHGKNGFGTYNAETGTVIAVPATLSTNELANMDGRDNPRPANNKPDTADTANVDYVSSFQSATFDDIVDWISPNILNNRMVSAGKLP